MDTNDLFGIENQIDYKFKNKDLLQQAFVRRSYSAENGGGDNEILEFIGDKVLDLIVVQLLVEEYGFMSKDCDDYVTGEYNEFFTDCDEGELTEIKKNLVQRKNLADRIDMLGFADYLIMGNSDYKNHAEEKDSVKEDLFEAIVGAVAIDCEWNLDTLKQVVEQMLEPDLSEDDDNFIQWMQEWSLRRNGRLPLYHVEKYNQAHWYTSGYIYYDRPNVLNAKQPDYKAYMQVDGIDDIILGFGDSKKSARVNAAKTAYEYLEHHNMLFTIRDEIENPNRQDAISQLEILARRGYFAIPEYEYTQEYDTDGNPIWFCTCEIKEYKKRISCKASTKKDAKKDAAFKMLKFILDAE